MKNESKPESFSEHKDVTRYEFVNFIVEGKGFILPTKYEKRGSVMRTRDEILRHFIYLQTDN